MASFTRHLAVDVGVTSLRLLELAPDGRGRPTVVGLAEVGLEGDASKPGEMFPALVAGLQEGRSKIASRCQDVVFTLGGPSVFTRLIKIPPAAPAKLAQMIQFEAQQTVPAIEQALWDHQILPSSDPSSVEIMLFAIKKETVEELMAACAAAGLRCQAVTLAPASLLNAYRFNYPEGTGCTLVLDIGARATNLLLLEEGKIFARVIPLGGGSVTQAVATDTQDSQAGAETLKKAKGFVHPGGSYADADDPVASRISKLARGVMTRLHTEVERSITFYRSQQGGEKPSQVLLAGGGALLGYTDLFFQEKLKAPVHFFQPFRRLALAGPALPNQVQKNFPVWAAAVGASLQAIPDVPMGLNVLRSRTTARTSGSLTGFPALVGAVSLALLLLLPGVHGFWKGTFLEGQLTEKKANLQEAQLAIQDQAKAKQALEETLRRMELVEVLERQRFRWPRLLEELRKQSEPGMWMTRLETKSAEAGSTAAAPPPPELLILEGMFETRSREADARAVEKFREKLEKGGLLRSVVIQEREAPREVEGRTDQVALTFRLQAEWPREDGGNQTGKSKTP